jgi:two-component system response regulator FixJ
MAAASKPPKKAPASRVFVIDDDEAVRRAIAMLLRSAGIGAESYPSGLAFLDALPFSGEAPAECVLTDVRMPDLDGLELLRRLKERNFRGPVVVMTAHGDVSTAVRAMKAGAVDFIEKPFDDDALLAMIRTALNAADAPRVAESSVKAFARLAALSPREREVLELLMLGKPNKAIARDLGLSPRTVEIHRARLLTRLEVGSLAEAVRLAVQAELAPARGEYRSKLC